MNNDVLSVSQLNREVARLLEQEFAWVWVEGEISNLARPASGHIYFSLKDSDAQIRCAMFRGRNRDLKFDPDNGMQVQVRGKVSLYQPRGDYQLIVDRMQEAGAGLLQQQFEKLKAKLQAEGLFEAELKQTVPSHARNIAVITSRSGAAVRDVLSVIRRRFPATPVSLYPVSVQGEAAAGEICHALELADANTEHDVILLVRGGGSLEDLWSFNEESVARAIHACETPVVSGVGHEVDFTIADFVADLRAATPTAAAEAVTPDQQAWFQALDNIQLRLQQSVQDRILAEQQQLGFLQTRLKQQHPLARLQQLQSRVQQLGQQLQLHVRLAQQRRHAQQRQLQSRLLACSPQHALQLSAGQVEQLWQSLHTSMQNRLQQANAQLATQAATLQALSPLNTLARGYSITTDADGRVINDSASLQPDDIITTRLKLGRVSSKVTAIDPGETTD